MTQSVLEPVDLVQQGDLHTGPSRGSRVTARFAKPIAQLRGVPHIGTYAGIGLVALGAVLLVIAWGRVAGKAEVALQVPYVVSAGFIGLGLIAAGLTVVNINAKLADARERSRQISELRDLLSELHRAVAGKQTP